MPLSGISSILFSAYIINTTNFVPDLSLCNSYPIILCDLPFLRLILGIFSLKFYAIIFLYLVIFIPIYFFLRRFGYRETKEELNYKETKKDKKRWNKYGIYVALVFFPIYLIFLILFAD